MDVHLIQQRARQGMHFDAVSILELKITRILQKESGFSVSISL